MYKERIGVLDDHHKFLCDNEYIHKGYRLHFNTFQKIMKSVFLIHNETVNIWTHVLGGLLFICLLLYFIFSTDYSSNSLHYINYISALQTDFSSTRTAIHESLTQLLHEVREFPLCGTIETSISASYQKIFMILDQNEVKFSAEIQEVKRWPLLIFILSAIICLGCSSVCHLFGAHSKEVKKFVNSLDYAGIAILICGSFFPPIYYMFFCYDYLICTYLTAISIASLFALFISFSQEFQKPHCRWFRGVVFLILGLLGIIPMVHIIFL